MNNNNTFVLEKKGIVCVNGEYQVRTVKKEVDLKELPKILQYLDCQDMDNNLLNTYIVDLGKYFIDSEFLCPEKEIPGLCQYNQLQQRKHFFQNICLRKLKMKKEIHFKQLSKEEYQTILQLYGCQKNDMDIIAQIHGQTKFYVFTHSGFKSLQKHQNKKSCLVARFILGDILDIEKVHKKMLEIKNLIPIENRIETLTLRLISQSLPSRVQAIKQFSVLNYRIDMYLPDYKIAIECDEYAHGHYDQEKEKKRESEITQELGCTFFRYDPYSQEFNIFSFIGQIRNLIKEPLVGKLEESTS